MRQHNVQAYACLVIMVSKFKKLPYMNFHSLCFYKEAENKEILSLNTEEVFYTKDSL